MQAKTYIYILCFLLSINYTFSKPQKDITAPSKEDMYYYSLKYKNCKNVYDVDSVYASIGNSINNEISKQLNTIAKAVAINKFGLHKQALEILNTIKITDKSCPLIVKVEYHSALGSIAMRNEDPALSLKHMKMALDLTDSTLSNEIIQAKLINYGTALNANGNNKEAWDVFNKALLMEKKNNRNSLYLRLNIALTNSYLKNYEKAKEFFNEAIVLIKKENDVFAEIRTLGNIADIYIEQDSIKKAIDLYNEAIIKAMTHGFALDLIRLEGSLAKAYETSKDYTNAYYHKCISDSIRNEHNSKSVSEKIIEMEMQHKIEKERIEKEMNQKLYLSQKRGTYFLITGLVILLVLCLFLLYQLKLLKHKNKILVQQSISSINKKENSNEKRQEISDTYKELIDKLELLIYNEKHFANPELSLDSLSKMLDSNRTYLSEAINSHFNQSFSQWINEIRINEAKKMLSSVEFDKYSIEGIAEMAGWSSTSAFNSNFKKITGITPSYFRKNRNT